MLGDEVGAAAAMPENEQRSRIGPVPTRGMRLRFRERGRLSRPARRYLRVLG
jgi:hypothetical protein